MNKFDKLVTAIIDGEPFKGTYGELVREFADETTTPNGVASRYHIRECHYCIYEIDGKTWDERDYNHWTDASVASDAYADEAGFDLNDIKETEKTSYDLWSWGVSGNHPRKVLSFDHEHEAEESLLESWESDMNNNDQRTLDFDWVIENEHA